MKDTKDPKQKTKKLCKLVKNDIIKDSFVDYVKVINTPTHVCKKCGRSANDEKYLCNGIKIKEE